MSNIQASAARKSLRLHLPGLLALIMWAAACSDRMELPIDPQVQQIDPTSLQAVSEYERATLPLISSSLQPSSVARADVNVLVFGDFDPARGPVSAELAALGYDVTVATTLPEDLSAFDVIWQTSAFVPLTSHEITRLAAFLTGGGGLHLSGELSCCEALNASVQMLINMVVVGGGITVGDQGDIGPPYRVNPSALRGVTTTPNVITNYVPFGPGGILGVSDAHALATGASGIPIGAVWDGQHLIGGTGRLTLLMDVNWYAGGIVSGDNRKFIENIQVFLKGDASPPICTPVEIAAVWSDGTAPGTIRLADERVYVAVHDVEAFIPRPARAADVRIGASWESSTPARSFSILDLNGDGSRDVRVEFRTRRLLKEGHLPPATTEITVWGRDRTTETIYCGTAAVNLVP